MVTILILAATLASQCAHHVPLAHHAKHARPATVAECSPILPYAGWQPRDNEDSLMSEFAPLTIGPLTKYLTITTIEPCHVYSSYSGVFGSESYWPTSGGHIQAPEIDPRGGVEAVTILALGLMIIKGGRAK